MSTYTDRIDDLEARLEREREGFERPDDPEERALYYLREGVGPAVHAYCEARTGGPHLPAGEVTRLEDLMNEWLTLYARCYDVEMDCEFPLRTAAELLVETHNVRDTAVMLTKVPARG